MKITKQRDSPLLFLRGNMSKKPIQHVPGERFLYGTKIYEAYLDKTVDCEGCAFNSIKKCLDLECRAEERDDMQNIKYKCIGDACDFNKCITSWATSDGNGGSKVEWHKKPNGTICIF